MSFVRKFVIKAKAVVAFLESPKAQQVWRLARIAAFYVASTGVVDQLANGTATRAGIAAALTGAFEATYRAKVKA